MLEFRAFGTPDLRHSGGVDLDSVLQQPKRLALIAYLALASSGRWHSRDRLLGIFWPQIDDARARHALSQSLYFLRKQLGPGVLLNRGHEDVGLDPERLWCDAAAFRSTARRGEFASAVDLYRGDLLESFYVSDAPEFERWLEEERGRLRELASTAARTMVARSRAENPTLALAWARRAAAISPFDEVALRELIQLLDRTGDRCGAVRTYEAFERRLKSELELEPASETHAVIRAILERERDSRATAAPLDVAATGSAVARRTDFVGPETADADPGPPAAGRDRRRMAFMGWGMAGAAALAATVAYALGSSPDSGRRVQPTMADLPSGTAVVDEVQRSEVGLRSAQNRDAYTSYRLGRYFAAKRTQAGLQSAIEHFGRALDLEPDHAAAYAGLGTAYILLHAYNGGSDAAYRGEAMLRAKAAAERALALDSTLDEAHTALAFYEHLYAWNWPAAEEAYRRAVALAPDDAMAHQWLALYLCDVGRLDEALVELRRALALDPVSLIINRNLGYVLFSARRYDDAIEQYGKTLELDPDFPLTREWLRNAYVRKGLHEEALAEQRTIAIRQDWPAKRIERLGDAYAEKGWSGVMELILAHAHEKAEREYVAPTVFARLYAQMGREDQALGWLERGLANRAAGLSRIKVDPGFDPLRSDPRFAAVLAELGLDEN